MQWSGVCAAQLKMSVFKTEESTGPRSQSLGKDSPRVGYARIWCASTIG